MMFWDKVKRTWRRLKEAELKNVLATAKAQNLGITTKWKRYKNTFTGCINIQCPHLSKCTNNPYFRTCPISSPAFLSFNSHDRVAVGHNTIMNDVLDKIADDFAGVPNAMNLRVQYIAVGSGSAPTDGELNTLQNEGYRAPLTAVLRPELGQMMAYWYIPPNTASGSWYEWALVADMPSATPESGRNLNRWIDEVHKTAVDTLTGQYEVLITNPTS